MLTAEQFDAADEPSYFGREDIFEGYGDYDDYDWADLAYTYVTLSDRQHTGKRSAQPRRRAKGSLTMNGLKRLLRKGHRNFWIASSHFRSCDEFLVESLTVPAGFSILHGDTEDTVFMVLKYVEGQLVQLTTVSKRDKNLYRNYYNDWWVFPTKRAAERYVRRGR